MAVMGFKIAFLLAAGCAVTLAASAPRCAGAESPLAGGTEPDPGVLCSEAVALAERAEAIPRHLLAAIAQVESGRPVAEDRVEGPWPWTVSARGTGMFFASKAQAMEAAADALATGEDNVDVGCLQINIGHHPDAFMTLDEALDPLANAAYGAAYLRALFMQTGRGPRRSAATTRRRPHATPGTARRSSRSGTRAKAKPHPERRRPGRRWGAARPLWPRNCPALPARLSSIGKFSASSRPAWIPWRHDNSPSVQADCQSR